MGFAQRNRNDLDQENRLNWFKPHKFWPSICVHVLKAIYFGILHFEQLFIVNAPRGIPSTEFKPSAYTNYAEEMEKIVSRTSDAISRARKIREIDVEHWGKLLLRDFRDLAQCCVLTHEFGSAQQSYHNIVRLEILMHRIINSQLFPKLQKKGQLPPFHGRLTNGFTEAILATDEVSLLEFSRLLDPGKKAQSDNTFSWYVTNAVRLHILGDEPAAKENILKAHKLEYFRLASKGYSHAILGIIDRDHYLVNEGIALRIANHKTKEFKSIYFEYSEEATALARLAIRAGLRPNIQSPFINKEMLTDHERPADKTVDNLRAAFEYANDRKGKFLWWLREMFTGG